MDNPSLLDAWNDSYLRRENHVFWPSDELVRFVSRHIRRRIGIGEVVDVAPDALGSRVLDAGCGIGRNLVFGHEMGLIMHGMDLSQVAIDRAREWLSAKGAPDAEDRVVQADISQLPWEDSYFSHAFSESALDSMPFQVAQAGVAEIARTLKPGGLFYCSLISGDETGRDENFAEEVLISDKHEQDTIQQFFNEDKVKELLAPHFNCISIYLVQTRYNDKHHGRWHFIGSRK